MLERAIKGPRWFHPVRPTTGWPGHVVRAVETDDASARSGFIRLALACLPVLVAVVALGFLTTPIRTHHWNDERVFYWPIIAEFSRSFPRFNFADYNSSTPPLFFAVMATLHKYVSSSIAVLRGINLSMMLAAGLVFYATFRRFCDLDRRAAAAGSAAIAYSPYMFGNSLLLMTDTMALLWFALAMYFTLLHHERDRISDLMLALMFVMLASLTRQIYAWMLPAIALYLAASRPWRTTLSFLPAIVMSAFPLLVIFSLWGGITPPKWSYKVTKGALSGLGTFGLALAVLGLYTLAIVVPSRLGMKGLSALRPRLVSRAQALVLAATALLLIVVPMGPAGAKIVGQAGYLWKLAQATPTIGASSLLFWILVPAGALFLLESMRRLGAKHPLAWMLLGALTAGLTLSDAYQKYFDPAALILLLACASRFGVQDSRYFRLSLVGLCGFGLAYALMAHFYINAA